MYHVRRLFGARGLAAALVLASATARADVKPATAEVTIDGASPEVSSRSELGFTLLYRGDGPQAAVTRGTAGFTADLTGTAAVVVRVKGVGPGTVTVEATAEGPKPAIVSLGAGTEGPRVELKPGETRRLETTIGQGQDLLLSARSAGGDAGLSLRDLRIGEGERTTPLALSVTAGDPGRFPPPELPALRPAIERALVEWDWRMQDGLGTPREPSTLAAAIARTLDRGDQLLGGLKPDPAVVDAWRGLRSRFDRLVQAKSVEGPEGERLWLEAHQRRRALFLSSPVAATGPLVFVKHVPSSFSHQLTQYPGNCARPGGGLFVLEAPGSSMRTRRLDHGLPTGSYEFADVSYDGRTVLFAFCAVDRVPPDRVAHLDRHFHLYEASVDGPSPVRQLTDGPYDDFAGRYLPSGKIAFISTRRGGFHRCGAGPCPVHALAVCDADGSDPHPISFHETHEWDPSVGTDGRLVYTRWDYVDRHAVHYQQLWSARPDGSDVRALYGNATLSPVGVWEARPVPGSGLFMATASAHHAMSAGSIIRVDPARGVDGPEPITRLTPDALFPESEAPVSNGAGGGWSASYAVTTPPPDTPDARRWPGHCYKAPQPLSESVFLASYSFDPLIGEPSANPANGFGLYLVDAFGNKELLYRDLNIGSVWAMPVRPRPRPPVLAEVVAKADAPREGTFFLSDVYQSWPPLPAGSVKGLRVLQVLPKTTWHANQPMLGLPSASPGKQVLGTVPVEADGSAYFRAPAGIPLTFQAIDEKGRAVQVMRSLTYLQPGEVASCVGCHEPRTTAPAQPSALARALSRPPSTIRPAPDGSRPLSYPILVQPVLDRQCVSCHDHETAAGKLVLTGEPEGRYTASYNALAPRVPYADWGGRQGDFRVFNSEPVSKPGAFGSRASSVMDLLLAGHHGVKLSAEDLDRLTTWMDANALFYGSFDPADQARQQRGERIAEPKLQ